MATSGRMLRDEPEKVRVFLKGVMRAQQFMHDKDPMGQDALEILKRVFQVDTLEASRFQNGRAEAWPLQAGDVMASAEGVSAHVDELKAKGKLPESYSVEQVLRNEPAMQALAELGFGDQRAC
jgi:ABC-type nitrate/sulfonate/bicarbonate transport system substrate-binding protein